jgi:hypothetical protein
MLTIRNVRRVGTLIEFVVDHPDGGVLSVPAWATDYTPHLPPPRYQGAVVFFHPTQLLTLSSRVEKYLESTLSSSDKTLDRVAPNPGATPPGQARTAGEGEPDDAARHSTRITARGPVGSTPTVDPSHGATRRAHATPKPKGGLA